MDVIRAPHEVPPAQGPRTPAHPRGYLKALDALDEVIALIRRSPTVDEARAGLIDLLDVDAIQADAILALQLRRLAALERQKIMDEHAELKARVDDLNDILAKPERQRAIISAELSEIVDKFGDERRTRILPFDGEMSMEDLIPEEDVVVHHHPRPASPTRTRTDNYRSQKRGGKGVRGTQLRGDDVVEHFFVTTTHNWLLFFTNLGRVYRAKAYKSRGGRDAKASTSPTSWHSSPTSTSRRSSRSVPTRTRTSWSWPPSAASSRRPR